MNKKKLIISAIFILTVMTGSFIYSNQSKNLKVSSDETIVISEDYPVTEDLKKMIDESELIVMGEYKNFDSSWNMARDPEDNSKSDDEYYIEGRIFKFKVDKVLLGHAKEDIIDVNLRYSRDIEYSTSDGNNIKFDYKNPLYMDPEIGKRYLLFLKKDLYYYGAIEPFQIQIDKYNKAILKSNLIDIKESDKKEIIKIDDKSLEIVSEAHEIKDNITGKNIEELFDMIEEKK